MIRIREAVIVEGKYDKAKLSPLLDATILETNGFRIFRDREKVAMIRAFAEKTGVLLLTDSDAAGFRIRRYVCGCVPAKYQGNIRHAYIPEILGKERRKAVPSREGTLGVEGMPAPILLEALRRAGVIASENNSSMEEDRRPITKQDLYELGFSGTDGSAQRRQELLRRLNLPHYLTANSLVPVLNALFSYEDLKKLADEIQG